MQHLWWAGESQQMGKNTGSDGIHGGRTGAHSHSPCSRSQSNHQIIFRGETGYFKIAKGVNNLGIEAECSFGVPAATGVIAKSEEKIMGSEDHLVTSQDLGPPFTPRPPHTTLLSITTLLLPSGASIDGTESLVQIDSTASKRTSPTLINDNIQATVVPKPVVDAGDDHAKDFSSASVKKMNHAANTGPSMNADADPAFQKAQHDQGVGN
jgi:hypothetical protein